MHLQNASLNLLKGRKNVDPNNLTSHFGRYNETLFQKMSLSTVAEVGGILASVLSGNLFAFPHPETKTISGLAFVCGTALGCPLKHLKVVAHC